MEKGTSLSTRMIIKFLEDATKEEIESFIRETEKTPIKEKDFTEDISSFEKSLSMDDYMTIRSYTGFDFKNINAILRGSWTYEENGLLNDSIREKYENLSEEISSLVRRFPSPKENFRTYRGTTLSEFKKYGISSIEELINLKGKYLYEEGFTSTSLEEESSYYQKEIFGRVCNIEIKYLISGQSQDGMPLNNDELSYSKNQKEYLLDCGTLSRVIDVQIDNDTAVLTVIVIPKKVWNKERYIKKEENKQNTL